MSENIRSYEAVYLPDDPPPPVVPPGTAGAQEVLAKSKLEEIADVMDDGALESLRMLRSVVQHSRKVEEKISAARVILGSASYLKARKEETDGETGTQVVVHLNIQEREATVQPSAEESQA